MMADDKDAITLLRRLDKLIVSKSATVADLVEQAIVASEIADEPWETWRDAGPLERMYQEMQVLINTVSTLQADISSMRSSSYQNVTWTNTTDGTQPWRDPLRNWPIGYDWDPISRTVIKTSSGTGT